MNDLDSLEKKIDLTVLKWYNREDYRAKQERFRQTVMAAHTIVSQKLYKTKSQTVESYFRDVWKISRASVYRFLDCALVLEQLKDFPDWSKPSHERLCRSLKKLTKNPVHMRYLWKKVLLKAGDNPNLITSTFIKKVWQELITSGEMPNVDENDENNLFKKKKGTSKNSKLESSNSNSKLKKKINNDQSLLQYNGNNNSYNNDNNNMKSNQDVSNQCDSNNNSQYNLSLSSSLSSSQTFKIESTDHSPSFSELNIQQNMNNTISVPSNDNWIHDSSQSIINPNLSCSSNSSSSCSSTYGMNDNEQNHSHSIGDSLENYNKYRILSPPLSTASSYSNLPFHKQINIKENELISSINLQNKNNRNEKCININNNNNNNNNININNNNNNYNNNSNNNYNNNNINNNNNNYNNNNNNNNNAFIIDQYVYCLASSNNTKIKSNENNNYNYTNINYITNQQNLNSNSNISSYKTINSFNKNNNISNNELCQNQYTKNTENNINQSMTLTETMNENSSSKEIKPAWSLSMEIFNNSNYNNNNNKNSNSNKNNTDDFNQNHIESKNISSSILNIENLL